MRRSSVILWALIPLAACGSGNPPDPSEETVYMTHPSGLSYIDHEIGEGDTARPGQTVEVHYTGWLYVDGERGTKFDSSLDRGEAFSFLLGTDGIIQGWNEGVQGMRVGGTRELIIPPELGYGTRGAGTVIPSDATLNFEIELLAIRP